MNVVTAILLLVLGITVIPNETYGNPTLYYVALNGDDSNSGTSLETPFATINKAVSVVKAGDTIFVRGGTYKPTKTINPTVSGTAAARITLRNYGSEKVIIDGSNVNEGKAGSKVIRMDNIAYWTISKINVTRSPGMGIGILNYANNIRFEDLNIYNNGGTGLSIENFSYDNYINGVNSYFNYDEPTGGEHADGFAVKAGSIRNTFNRCKAWNNSDDGWDFWGGGQSQITKSEAFRNGMDANGNPYPNGDGNGFKLGGHSAGGWSGNNTIRTSVAYDNLANGFDWNNASLKNMVYNSTAYNNNRGNFSYAYNFRFGNDDIIRNSISAGTGGVRLADTVDHSHNNWNLGLPDPVFASTTPGTKNFLYLTANSPYIGVGTNVGLTFSGNAPDLGAFEYGEEWR
ncbi:right-handed parallel beta-helix repeat-containing protein [Paenibacillus tarimensis]|uniref:right-handed parallel beta-helix repeat-containing protein n=1 Tax=Paenibacillus tarimensis TaxID=416012 RepID=UPI001F3BE29F|nr:right-handed parallel beta-helix repeat-containing protein [Paenibacillus tarimensis]MCF2944651.1 right-handed parallel beta-helix repeat-containing protein [Paenibacillus tarimensis]